MVLDESIEAIEDVLDALKAESELTNFQFSSNSVLLENLQKEILSSDFSRSFTGLRGLVLWMLSLKRF